MNSKRRYCSWLVSFFILSLILFTSGCTDSTTSPSATTSTKIPTTSSSGGASTPSTSGNSNSSTVGSDGGMVDLDGEQVAATGYNYPSDTSSVAGDSQGTALGITLKNSKNGNLYYDIVGGSWTDSEKQLTQGILTQLPQEFRGCTKEIYICSDISDQKNGTLGGFCYYDNGKIFLTKSMLDYCLVHEMAHAWHYKHPDLLEQWITLFWNKGNSSASASSWNPYDGYYPKTTSVSDYGNSNPMEDLAESVREYFQNGASLKASDPERYEFVKKNIMSGKEY